MNRDTDRQTDRQTNRLTDDKKTSAKANSILQVHVYAGMGSSTKFSASSISTIRCASTLSQSHKCYKHHNTSEF